MYNYRLNPIGKEIYATRDMTHYPSKPLIERRSKHNGLKLAILAVLFVVFVWSGLWVWVR